MSTTAAIYIYPLQNTHQILESSSNSYMDSNGEEGKSSLIIPIDVTINTLTSDTNIPAKAQKLIEQQQPQRFWLSNSSSSAAIIEETMHNNSSAPLAANACTTTSDFVESCTVTHSFANRKRSIVKRRKSVLSSSFTADDESEKNMVESNIEANSAELETTSIHTIQMEATEEMKETDLKEIKENQAIHEEEEDKGIHFKSDDLTFDRGYQRQQQQGEMLASEQVPSGIKKDSAIDLRTTTTLDEPTLTGTSAPCVALSRSSSSDSLCSSSSSSFDNTTTPQKTPSIAPKKKKKVSSWSPRKIFQSDNHEKKLSKKASMSSLQGDKKFSISSIFSRKSSSNKNKPYSDKQQAQESSSSSETLPIAPSPPFFNYTRLPIHTERAIYRISHIKLANTKRPLRDQVVISNLMFWYLSIVNQPYEENFAKTCRKQMKQKRNQQAKSRYQSPYSQTSSSSDDEDSDDNDDEELLTSSDEEPKEKKKKRKYYSLFYTNKKKENTSWLPSFATPKQHDVTIRDNEDDIPLAMYQRSRN